jgi:hypothetical protein
LLDSSRYVSFWLMPLTMVSISNKWMWRVPLLMILCKRKYMWSNLRGSGTLTFWNTSIDSTNLYMALNKPHVHGMRICVSY